MSGGEQWAERCGWWLALMPFIRASGLAGKRATAVV